MNIHAYFIKTLFPQVLEDSMEETFLEWILDEDGGAGDGCSIGAILNEMPKDSVCGGQCARVIDAASAYLVIRDRAYPNPDHSYEVRKEAALACLTFIRG